VNTGGVTLTVFELVTAIFAADNYNLRKDWEDREKRLRRHKVLHDVDATTFLTTVTLLSSYKANKLKGSPVTCKRRDILRLSLEEYKANASDIERGLELASRFLAREKIFDVRSIPYDTQLIPLSAICTVLDKAFEQEPIRDKLSQWFWNGVFGELYGGANESRFAMDIVDVITWVNGGDIPRTIRDSSFAPTRLLSIQSRLSAAYKGLMALLMKEGCNDFISGDQMEITSYFDLGIDIHHIFPRSYCEKQYKREQWNSAVNKTMLSAKTNRIIGGNAPSVYLASIEKSANIESNRLNQILSTHLIDSDCLRSDSFQAFILNRASRLLNLIENATGKVIPGRDSEEVIREFGGVLPNM